jgi:uracil-DNA glycosylase family 4
MLKPPQCRGCPLFSKSNGFSIPDGNGTNGVVVVGEALGYEEYLDGQPFRPRAQAGSKLEEAFQISQTPRQGFLLYNTIQCNPFHDNIDTPDARDAIAFCKVHRDKVIGGFRTPFTKTLLGLGQTPLVALTGVSGEAKNKESITHLRGYVFPTSYGPMVASLHPSYLRRGKPSLTPFLVADLKKALAIAKGEYRSYRGGPDYVEPRYQIHPSLDEAQSFYYRVKDSPKLLLTYDIETPLFADLEEDEREGLSAITPTLIQFSLAKGEGIAFPYIPGYIELSKKIMALPNIKANHNTWNFDNPILQANGFEIGGKIHDTLWMFKQWHPGLERGLQKVASLFNFPFPWKHLYGAQLEWYGCADVDAVQWIMDGLPKLMAKDGTWGCYKEHVFNLYSGPLLRASKIGIPVSIDKWNALFTSIKERMKTMDKEIQALIPEHLKNCSPAHGYKRVPKVVEEITESYITQAKAKLAQGILPKATLRQVVKKMLGMEKRHFVYEEKNKATGESIQVSEDRWCKVLPFTASSVQVIKYLKWKQTQCTTKAERFLYEVPMTTQKRGEDSRATTGKDEIKYIVEKTGDPVLSRVMSLRSYQKMLTNDLPNWKPGEDGKVHTTWGFKAPSGQLDSTKPNIQNCSKHSELGQEFRGIIEAEVGYEFSEIDYKTFHVAVMGWVANDPSYIKYSQMDPHSIFGSHIVDDPDIPPVDLERMTPAQIKEITTKFKAKYKEVRQNVAKPSVLGNQLGLGPMRLHRQNRKYITSKGEAERLQAILARLFPIVEKAKVFLQELAHRQKYLSNPWGRRQDFWEVFTYAWDKRIGNWKRGSGGDSERAIAFMVQSCAFGMIAEKILECERLGYNERFQWINTIHDSSQFYHRLEQRAEFIAKVISIYTTPCIWLKAPACPEGLVVGVDYSVGRNWRTYDPETNPEGMREI